jgi:hypothetical protein
MTDDVINHLRKDLHRKICKNLLGHKEQKKKGTSISYLSCADVGSEISRTLAALMAKHMGISRCKKPKAAQTIGTLFASYVKEFIDESFARLKHIRAGTWLFSDSQANLGIAAFDQYEHLAELQRILSDNRKLAMALGGDYLITPDIVVGRYPEEDATLNSQELLLSPGQLIANLTPLRAANYESPKAILHASISCKWTMRSDRAQNTRTEALNLIRNRKGKTPQICAVTMEPMPTRISSIAMGTGDVDCTYHAALHELVAAAKESKSESQHEILQDLIEGRRLRDISDLPFDLAQ